MSTENLEDYHFEMEHWRWCDHLSVVEASMLAVGINPSKYEPAHSRRLREGEFHRIGSSNNTKNYFHSPYFPPVFRAISDAAIRGELACTFMHNARSIPTLRFGDMETDAPPEFYEEHIDYDILIQADAAVSANFDMPEYRGSRRFYFVKEPNWERSSIKVSELRDWMQGLGRKPAFFFPETETETETETEGDAFRNEEHEHFSAELDYAVTVWQALLPQRKYPGGVKAAIEAWITDNPSEWKGDDSLSAAAKDRIATLVNWNKGGGAPRSGG